MALYKLETGGGDGSLATDITRVVELEDITYDLRFRWNTRDESWTVSCAKSGGDMIFRTKVRTNIIFNAMYKHRTDAPQGDFVIVDMSEADGRVGFESFNISGRFRLFYNTSE